MHPLDLQRLETLLLLPSYKVLAEAKKRVERTEEFKPEVKRRRISIQGTRCQMCPNCKNAQTAKQACYVNILMTFPEFQDRDIIITTMRRLGFSEFGLPPQPVKGATVADPAPVAAPAPVADPEPVIEHCTICRTGDKMVSKDKALLCDLCNREFHLVCLEKYAPEDQRFPEDDSYGHWYCPACHGAGTSLNKLMLECATMNLPFPIPDEVPGADLSVGWELTSERTVRFFHAQKDTQGSHTKNAMKIIEKGFDEESADLPWVSEMVLGRNEYIQLDHFASTATILLSAPSQAKAGATRVSDAHRPVAAAVVRFWAPAVCEILAIATTPFSTRQGHGRALINVVESLCALLGINRMVALSRNRSQNFWTGLKFRAVPKDELRALEDRKVSLEYCDVPPKQAKFVYREVRPKSINAMGFLCELQVDSNASQKAAKAMFESRARALERNWPYWETYQKEKERKAKEAAERASKQEEETTSTGRPGETASGGYGGFGSVPQQRPSGPGAQRGPMTAPPGRFPAKAPQGGPAHYAAFGRGGPAASSARPAAAPAPAAAAPRAWTGVWGPAGGGRVGGAGASAPSSKATSKATDNDRPSDSGDHIERRTERDVGMELEVETERAMEVVPAQEAAVHSAQVRQGQEPEEGGAAVLMRKVEEVRELEREIAKISAARACLRGVKGTSDIVRRLSRAGAEKEGDVAVIRSELRGMVEE